MIAVGYLLPSALRRKQRLHVRITEFQLYAHKRESEDIAIR